MNNVAYNETFRDQRIELNGRYYHLCTFINCAMVFNRDGDPGGVPNATIVGCTIEGDGWPQGTLGEARSEWEGNLVSRVAGIWDARGIPYDEAHEAATFFTASPP